MHVFGNASRVIGRSMSAFRARSMQTSTVFSSNRKSGFVLLSAAAVAGTCAVYLLPTSALQEADDDKAEAAKFWRSQQQKPVDHHKQSVEQDLVVFSGNANRPLAEDIAKALGTKLGSITVARFADGEVNVQVHDNVRGKDVYIIQPTCTPVNENLVELLLMVSTMRRASARRITAVIPYYGYARQDRKMSSRVPISAADVARLLETMGVDRVIAVDLHCGQIQGFFGPRVPVDNLEANIIGLSYFLDSIALDDPVVVSPDAGGVYRARKFQEGLQKHGLKNAGLAMIIKQRAKASVIERMDLVGSVENSDVIIVDDMIDTAGTLVQAAAELKNKGAKRVYAFATHGLFSGPALKRIESSALEEVVVSDSIPLRSETPPTKIRQLSVAVVLAEAIRRVHQKESVSALFNK
eukprot:GILJ01002132.1.p1 GENE.GILJ01002132.1~~GILJ01002132.1.p1  ORF type:complete len:410 (-),score=66.42 GILJ01002132.1:94-1323(-)